MYEEHENDMINALDADLRRPKQESLVVETEFMKNDVKHILYNLNDWVKPEYPEKPLVNLMDDVQIYNDPYGVVLVIGAWNYPLQLLLVPVASAIAAGNCVVIKPSEIATNCAKFIQETLPKYLDNVSYCNDISKHLYEIRNLFIYVFYIYRIVILLFAVVQQRQQNF